MQHTSELAERLASISTELAHIARILANPHIQPTFPESARKRFSAGKCLQCERTKQTHQMRRGNCPTHYNKLMQVIREKGSIADFQFVEKGLLAPDGYNPNPTEFDEVVQALDEQESRLIAAAQKAIDAPERKRRGKSKSN